MKKRGNRLVNLCSLILATGVLLQLFSLFIPITRAAVPVTGVTDGSIYYIKNKRSGQYLTVNGTGNEALNGSNVVQQYFYEDLSKQKWQQWRVDYLGEGEYRIVSMASPSGSMKVLDVEKNQNVNKINIDVYSDANAADRRWSLVLSPDKCTYRILSKCSEYKKGAALYVTEFYNQGGSVLQFAHQNDPMAEWFFIPADRCVSSKGVDYAIANCEQYLYTFPDLTAFNGQSSDCANFVSQCLMAQGVKFQDEWVVYRKNSDYSQPTNSTQLDATWYLKLYGGFLGLGKSSPWISAKQFNLFWASRVSYLDYTGAEITSAPWTVYRADIYKGGAISIIENGEATHTMFISGYGSYEGKNTFLVSAHSVSHDRDPLLEIAARYPNATFRFFQFTVRGE